jgi:hypothetical protein
MSGLLTWKQTRSQTQRGSAGAIELFMFTWDGSKQHPGKPWVMTSDLPGLAGQRWRAATPEELPSVAEHVLAAWLVKIGVKRGAGT